MLIVISSPEPRNEIIVRSGELFMTLTPVEKGVFCAVVRVPWMVLTKILHTEQELKYEGQEQHDEDLTD